MPKESRNVDTKPATARMYQKIDLRQPPTDRHEVTDTFLLNVDERRRQQQTRLPAECLPHLQDRAVLRDPGPLRALDVHEYFVAATPRRCTSYECINSSSHVRRREKPLL